MLSVFTAYTQCVAGSHDYSTVSPVPHHLLINTFPNSCLFLSIDSKQSQLCESQYVWESSKTKHIWNLNNNHKCGTRETFLSLCGLFEEEIESYRTAL